MCKGHDHSWPEIEGHCHRSKCGRHALKSGKCSVDECNCTSVENDNIVLFHGCIVGVRSYIKESIMSLLEVHAEVSRHLVTA